jgi:acyl-CoA thioester hydrolase
MIYYHKFEVRWSDIDANRHLANSSYVQYCAQTRMAFMTKHKMGVAQLNRWGIGL